MTFNIQAFYDAFFEHGGPPKGSDRPWAYRRRETSLRLPGCLLLAELVRARKPIGILDLGSGITTHLLRRLAREYAGGYVVTTDLAPQWLETTRIEIERYELSRENLYDQAFFETMTWQPFELISVDIGNLSYRVGIAAKLDRWLAPGGVLVLDDFGMRDYAEQMTAALEALGFTVTIHPDTLDEFGCYMATAERTK